MRDIRILAAVTAVASMLTAAGAVPTVRAQQPAAPFKLGMFATGDRVFAGLVVDDSRVVDLSRTAPDLPATVQGLIARWDTGLASRLGQMAADARRDPSSGSQSLDTLRTRVPIDDPGAIFMAARNYADHANEMAQVGRAAGTTSVIDEKVRAGIPGLWIRPGADSRPNPYLFLKAKTSLIADGETVRLPPGRARIDYECELVAVIGRPARRVSVDGALAHVFGYMAMTDISDREDRADGRYGSDWLISKSHDTFGPVGPFVVPAAFVANPQALRIRYTLNGRVMQDDSTGLMVHTVRDLVSYASHIATLQPGDLIGTGTPGGVGEGRTPPVYLKPGDTGTCRIEGIGALTNPIRADGPAQ